MKYTYAYKTSDGVRHEAKIRAASREEVFATLRRQGIKPIKVVADDGTKANGEIRGVRKRVVVACSLAAAAVVGVAAYLGGLHNEAAGGDVRRARQCAARPLARQAIAGDRDRLDRAVDGLTNGVERFLAAFAEPGRTLPAGLAEPTPEALGAEAARPVMIAEDELTESIDLKRIVAGIKQELRQYIAGGGTPAGYIVELRRRQALEVSYREKAARRLNETLRTGDRSESALAEAYEYWLKANAQLQSMGIYPVPLPSALRNYQLSQELDE